MVKKYYKEIKVCKRSLSFFHLKGFSTCMRANGEEEGRGNTFQSIKGQVGGKQSYK